MGLSIHRQIEGLVSRQGSDPLAVPLNRTFDLSSPLARTHSLRVRTRLHRRRRAHIRARTRDFGIIALHAGNHLGARRERGHARLRRSGSRTYAARAVDLLHPNVVRRLSASRDLGLAPDGSLRLTVDALGRARNRTERRLVPVSGRALARVGAVVHRSRRDAHDADDSQLLPVLDTR